MPDIHFRHHGNSNFFPTIPAYLLPQASLGLHRIGHLPARINHNNFYRRIKLSRTDFNTVHTCALMIGYSPAASAVNDDAEITAASAIPINFFIINSPFVITDMYTPLYTYHINPSMAVISYEFHIICVCFE